MNLLMVLNVLASALLFIGIAALADQYRGPASRP